MSKYERDKSNSHKMLKEHFLWSACYMKDIK